MIKEVVRHEMIDSDMNRVTLNLFVEFETFNPDGIITISFNEKKFKKHEIKLEKFIIDGKNIDFMNDFHYDELDKILHSIYMYLRNNYIF